MHRIDTPLKRLRAHARALFLDHEILRKFYRNFYKLSDKAFRSNHPSKGFLRKLKRKYDIKTVINLRSANEVSFLLEKLACDQLGIELKHLQISSRRLPTVEQILEAKQLLETSEYPLLIHCKSGSDRAGLVSVLFMHFVEKQPMEIAIKQLSIKYGHFRWANTGKLDYFFDAFFAYQQDHPEIEFLDWLQNIYDREALDQTFESKGWANIVVHKILNRE